MRYSFKPFPDITAFELTTVIKNVRGFYGDWDNVEISEDQWREISENVRRHFKENPSVIVTKKINNWLAKW